MTPTERKQTRPFASWIQDVRGGSLHAELSEKLAELASACLEHGKGGTLQLTVALAPNSDGCTLLAHDTVKLKTPEADRATALFFADEEGNLTRSNPMQQSITGLSVVVDTGDGEYAEVDTATGELHSLPD